MAETDAKKLYCICRQPDDGSFMIACGKCDEWFHGRCVNIYEDMPAAHSSFICPACLGNLSNRTPSPAVVAQRTLQPKQPVPFHNLVFLSMTPYPCLIVGDQHIRLSAAQLQAYNQLNPETRAAYHSQLMADKMRLQQSQQTARVQVVGRPIVMNSPSAIVAHNTMSKTLAYNTMSKAQPGRGHKLCPRCGNNVASTRRSCTHCPHIFSSVGRPSSNARNSGFGHEKSLNEDGDTTDDSELDDEIVTSKSTKSFRRRKNKDDEDEDEDFRVRAQVTPRTSDRVTRTSRRNPRYYNKDYADVDKDDFDDASDESPSRSKGGERAQPEQSRIQKLLGRRKRVAAPGEPARHPRS